MKRPIQKVRGAILVMAAFILVILIGIAAFALDIGRLYVLHTEMQNAVDAAVLSAAAELDGEDDALDRAKAAADQEMLNHLSHFSKTNYQLLQGLPNENFIFYSWIGSDVDAPIPPIDCDPDANGKCVTTSDDNASYVQITLKPADTDDGQYTIDLYFLPVLSLFGIDTESTASTRVVALAGSHTEVCNYPPMFICDPTENGGETLSPGDMVILKEHTGGGTIVEGGFGWLMPGYSKEDPDDDTLGPNSPRLFVRRLGSKYPLDCSSPIVEINTGNIAGLTSLALNTRFGLYPKNFTNWYDQDDFPSAPNVIDYPRDSKLTIDGGPNTTDGLDCKRHDTERFGQGDWGVSLCNTVPERQPSTFTRTDYVNNFHGGTNPLPVPTGNETRNDYYNQEFSSGNLAVNTISVDQLHTDEQQCNAQGQGKCRMLNGAATAIYVDQTDEYKRRELFLAMVGCEAQNIGASNPIVDMSGSDTKWMRFFLTEHIGDPSADVDVYAEFIEEVTDKKDEHFRKVIQLYE